MNELRSRVAPTYADWGFAERWYAASVTDWDERTRDILVPKLDDRLGRMTASDEADLRAWDRTALLEDSSERRAAVRSIARIEEILGPVPAGRLPRLRRLRRRRAASGRPSQISLR